MAPKVFLSYQHDDLYEALWVRGRLVTYGLDVYWAEIDPDLRKDGPELSDDLRRELGKCSQLLTVVSANTKQSWWVPWEIGLATEKGYRIATYLTSRDVLKGDTPSYLWKWPYLVDEADLSVYARLSTNYAVRDSTAGHSRSESDSVRATANADQFHRELKQQLRQ